PVVLLVVPVVHLHRMAHRAGGYEKRDDQNQGVERKTDQPDEPESPDCADYSGDGWPQRTPPVVEVQIQEYPQRDDGDHENSENLWRVVIDPAIEDRRPVHIDADARVPVRIDDQLVGLFENLAIIEAAFEEGCSDLRGLFIQRNELPEHHSRIFVNVV